MHVYRVGGKMCNLKIITFRDEYQADEALGALLN